MTGLPTICILTLILGTFTKICHHMCHDDLHIDVTIVRWLWLYKYVVWQKSNETDFLLTMNFIRFTNRSYPLQNSSLGQLHCDGAVASIVCSSAGRILLVYLSAHRFMLFWILSKVSFQVVFEPGE